MDDISYTITNTSKDLSSSLKEYPQITFNFKIKRKYGFYLWNIIFIYFLMCLSSLSSFSIDDELVSEKLNVSFMTLLTVVALKFSTTAILPKVSYLTILDKYIIFCILFQILVIVQNSLYTFLDIYNYNFYSFIILTGILGLFNIGFLFKI